MKDRYRICMPRRLSTNQLAVDFEETTCPLCGNTCYMPLAAKELHKLAKNVDVACTACATVLALAGKRQVV